MNREAKLVKCQTIKLIRYINMAICASEIILMVAKIAQHQVVSGSVHHKVPEATKKRPTYATSRYNPSAVGLLLVRESCSGCLFP